MTPASRAAAELLRLARGVRSRASERPVRWAASLLVALVAITAGATLYTAHVGRAQARQHADRDAELAVRTIDRRLVAYGEVLVAVRGLFELDPHPSRARFARFVSSLQLEARYPGVRVVSFAQVVEGDEIAGLTRSVRRDASARRAGYPRFRVHPASGPGRKVVLEYLDPIAGNERALGFDLHVGAR